MKLIYNCICCKSKNTFPYSAEDRGEIAMKYQNNLDLYCENCNTKNRLKPNDVIAVENKINIFLFPIAVIISAIFCYFTYVHYLGSEAFENSFRRTVFVYLLIIIIPSSFALKLINDDKKRVRDFNKYHV